MFECTPEIIEPEIFSRRWVIIVSRRYIQLHIYLLCIVICNVLLSFSPTILIILWSWGLCLSITFKSLNLGQVAVAKQSDFLPHLVQKKCNFKVSKLKHLGYTIEELPVKHTGNIERITNVHPLYRANCISQHPIVEAKN